MFRGLLSHGRGTLKTEQVTLSREILEQVTLSREILEQVTLSREILEQVTLSREILEQVTLFREILEQVTLSREILEWVARFRVGLRVGVCKVFPFSKAHCVGESCLRVDRVGQFQVNPIQTVNSYDCQPV
jgi:hypothetical protein